MPIQVPPPRRVLEDFGETTYYRNPLVPAPESLEEIAQFRRKRPTVGFSWKDMYLDYLYRRSLGIPSVPEDQIQVPEFEQPRQGYFLRQFHAPDEEEEDLVTLNTLRHLQHTPHTPSEDMVLEYLLRQGLFQREDLTERERPDTTGLRRRTAF